MRNIPDDDHGYEDPNFETIPDELWNIFPSHGKYIKEMMIFCGYQSRESILKLKDNEEVQKMLKFTIQNEAVLEGDERKKVFGMFYKQPNLLSIKPGLEPVFKRFISQVENLIKPVGRERNTVEPTCSTKTKNVIPKGPKPTPDELMERVRKWLIKESSKPLNRSLTEDNVENFGSMTDSGHSFKFKCNKVGCKLTFPVPYCESRNEFKLSNIYRHIKSCIFGTKRKESSSIQKSLCFTKSPSNFFESKKKMSSSNLIDLTEKRFIPKTPYDTDFEKENVSSKNLAIEISSPKNLKQPAGQHEQEDDSGL